MGKCLGTESTRPFFDRWSVEISLEFTFTKTITIAAGSQSPKSSKVENENSKLATAIGRHLLEFYQAAAEIYNPLTRKKKTHKIMTKNL